MSFAESKLCGLNTFLKMVTTDFALVVYLSEWRRLLKCLQHCPKDPSVDLQQKSELRTHICNPSAGVGWGSTKAGGSMELFS